MFVNLESNPILKQCDDQQKQLLLKYVDHLLYYNTLTNLISRRITAEGLSRLLSESVLLASYIRNTVVLDVGSGNGILGIPTAILYPEKNIVLIESKTKKSGFLRKVLNELSLKNIQVLTVDIREFKRNEREAASLIARGFPDFAFFLNLLSNKTVREVIVITSLTKIKKNKKSIENYRQRIYNIPLRDKIKILKLENVSRET